MSKHNEGVFKQTFMAKQTWPMREQELREQIAKEIEAYKPLFLIRKKAALNWRWGIEHTKEVAARIARGQK